MTDELKTAEADAKTVLADTKAEISKLDAEEVKTSGCVRAHIVWIIGLGSFIVGCATRFIHL